MQLALAISIAVLLVAAGFAVLVRNLRRPVAASAVDPEWVRRFSVARYRPIERLLCEADYEFLESQRGFRPGIARKLRAARRRVFLAYLRSLSRDFHKLHSAVRYLILCSPQDRPDLAAALFEQRIRFAQAMTVVRFRLALNALGIGTVSVEPLMALVDAMRSRAVMLSLPSAA